jgi:endonuclease G
MTVDEVEEMTGLDFFSALGDKTEQRIEANADLRDW